MAKPRSLLSKVGTGSLLALLLGIAGHSQAIAADFSFTKIADTNTPVPGGTGNFPDFADTPVTNGTDVFFTDDGTDGIYQGDGTNPISLIANTSTPVPGLPAFSFTGFDSDIHVGGSTIGFEGFIDDGTGSSDEITVFGLPLTNAADTVNSINPSNGLVFDFVNEPAVDSSTGALAFNGGNFDPLTGDIILEGVYTNFTGPLTTVVDTNTPVPGLAAFSFTDFDADVSFKGNIGIEGTINDGVDSETILLSATPLGGLTVIADTISTLSPSTGGVFTELDEPDVDGISYAFGADDSANGIEGIYASFLGGPLQIIADANTPVPGGVGTFTGFDDDQVSLDGEKVLFEGNFAGGAGIYLWHSGELFSVIDENGTLDGVGIDDLDLAFSDALDGDLIAFYANLSDGSEAIYSAKITKGETVPVPEPTSLLSLLIVSAAGMATVKKTRK